MAAMTYPLGPKIDPVVPMLSLAAATCAEERAQEEEFRYLRALRNGDVETAQDARTLQKRWLLLAARRNYAGYQAAVRAFGESGSSCPDLDNQNDELSYLLGLLSGIQAFQLDRGTGGILEVPTETPSKVLSGTRCLDSNEYWGLPDAMQAMSRVMLAAAAGDHVALEAADADLSKASAIGEADGVRLAQALQATLYTSQGNVEAAKQVIREHVASKRQHPSNPRYKLLDSLATRRLTSISDQLWTRATGYRTPFGKLGTFWDDPPAPESSLDFEEFLPSSPSANPADPGGARSDDR
jgi:hypothetical protein